MTDPGDRKGIHGSSGSLAADNATSDGDTLTAAASSATSDKSASVIDLPADRISSKSDMTNSAISVPQQDADTANDDTTSDEVRSSINNEADVSNDDGVNNSKHNLNIDSTSHDDDSTVLPSQHEHEHEQQQHQTGDEYSSIANEPVSSDESNLFVGDLARGLMEEELLRAFSKHGSVQQVSIKRDRNTGKNLGYGFVKMGSHTQAITAKNAMHRYELHGRRLRVGWAQKNTSLFIGGLDDSVTTEQLKILFRPFGQIDEENTVVVKGGHYGFVKYRYRLQAETARRDMNNAKVFDGSTLKIEWNNISGALGTAKHSASCNASQIGSLPTTPTARNSRGMQSFNNSNINPYNNHAGHVTNSTPVMHHQPLLQGVTTNNPIGIMYDQMLTGHTQHHSQLQQQIPVVAARNVHIQFDGPGASKVTEDMIRNLFKNYGPLIDVTIPKGRNNNGSAVKSSTSDNNTNNRLRDGMNNMKLIDKDGTNESNNNNTRGGPPNERLFAFIQFPLTPDGESCALNAINTLTGTTFNGLAVTCAFSKSTSRRFNSGGTGYFGLPPPSQLVPTPTAINGIHGIIDTPYNPLSGMIQPHLHQNAAMMPLLPMNAVTTSTGGNAWQQQQQHQPAASSPMNYSNSNRNNRTNNSHAPHINNNNDNQRAPYDGTSVDQAHGNNFSNGTLNNSKGTLNRQRSSGSSNSNTSINNSNNNNTTDRNATDTITDVTINNTSSNTGDINIPSLQHQQQQWHMQQQQQQQQAAAAAAMTLYNYSMGMGVNPYMFNNGNGNVNNSNSNIPHNGTPPDGAFIPMSYIPTPMQQQQYSHHHHHQHQSNSNNNDMTGYINMMSQQQQHQPSHPFMPNIPTQGYANMMYGGMQMYSQDMNNHHDVGRHQYDRNGSNEYSKPSRRKLAAQQQQSQYQQQPPQQHADGTSEAN